MVVSRLAVLIAAGMSATACLPFGDYAAVGGSPTVGGAGGADGAAGGGAGDVGGAGGNGAGADCEPLDVENPNCADCVQNGLETDVDCGGDACGPCALDAICGNDADCDSGNCDALVCVPAPLEPQCLLDPDGNATCADCELNGLETDVDCGGDACAPCAEAESCDVDADCVSGNCDSGKCGPDIAGCEPEDPENPSCGDCTQNGSETDEDCGGDACGPCHTDKGCAVDADCLSESCAGGKCAAPSPPECADVDPENPTCADCETNGLETDVDCGGDACPPCEIGDLCGGDADCASESCVAGSCSL
jgi:hypothetical protein